MALFFAAALPPKLGRMAFVMLSQPRTSGFHRDAAAWRRDEIVPLPSRLDRPLHPCRPLAWNSMLG
jgi:predicted 2-oxoglutarate/Fe(II)-dependent dioxygenase YbiX